MVKIRFDASIAESQQSVPDKQESISERIGNSQNSIMGRVLDSQNLK